MRRANPHIAPAVLLRSAGIVRQWRSKKTARATQTPKTIVPTKLTAVAALVASIGEPNGAALEYAAGLLAYLPTSIREALGSAAGAQAVMFGDDHRQRGHGARPPAARARGARTRGAGAQGPRCWRRSSAARPRLPAADRSRSRCRCCARSSTRRRATLPRRDARGDRGRRAAHAGRVRARHHPRLEPRPESEARRRRAVQESRRAEGGVRA